MCFPGKEFIFTQALRVGAYKRAYCAYICNISIKDEWSLFLFVFFSFGKIAVVILAAAFFYTNFCVSPEPLRQAAEGGFFMHKLQRVLVRLSNVVPDPESCTREELIKSARSYAKAMTDDYEGVVFDWRETETAGRWAYEYPCNVIFAKDDTENFISILGKCNAERQSFINGYLTELKETVGGAMRS